MTIGLIALNALAFVYQFSLHGAGPGGAKAAEAFVFEFGLIPCRLSGACAGAPDAPSAVATVFTSMFLHGGLFHILGNMLYLWIFGNNVEDTLGRVRFLLFYLLGGIAATVAQTFVTLNWGTAADARIPNLGASGAIAAVLGAYFILVPHSMVLTLVLPFFLFPLPAWIFLGVYFVYQALIGGLSFVQPQSGGGVAYFAHLGGIAFGLLTVKLFAAGRPRPIRPSY